LKLIDDASMSDAMQPSGGDGTAKVGMSRLRLPLANGQTITISGGGVSLTLGGINAQPGCTVIADMVVILADDADGGILG
jgi:hypothetical protein